MFFLMTYRFRSSSPRQMRARWWTVAIIFLSTALEPLISAESALAQSLNRQTRLAALRQQNAFQQQQSAVQAAVQQTTILLQNANQSFSQQNTAPPATTFQAQLNALQIALQHTTALQQSAFRSNSALAQMAVQQQSTLQTVLQQTINIQQSLSYPGSQLNAFQLQLLSQAQNSLTELITTPPRTVQRTYAGR